MKLSFSSFCSFLFIFTAMPLLFLAVLSNLWPWLDHLDKQLFIKLNADWTNSLFDRVFPWWREANAWIPFYLFLVLFGAFNFGRKVWPWLLMAVVTVIITDQLSSHFIKLLVARTRPCNETELAGQVRLLLSSCSGTYSFTSSHATNHFGFAMFLIVTLQQVFGRWRWWLLAWAGSIAYGQVYVGVHYPLDVICGALMGVGIGWLTGQFHNRRFGVLNLQSVEAS